MQENNLELAEINWRKAFDEVKNLTPSDPRRIMTQEYFADLLCQLQKFAEAEPLMLQLLEAKQSILEPTDLRIANTHNSLAGLYFAKQDFEQAEKHCTAAMKLHQEALGDEHPDVLLIMQNLAMLYHSKSQFDKAEPLYEQAIALSQKLHGPQSTLTMAITENYMGLLNATEQKEKSRKVKKTLILPVFDRLLMVVGKENEKIKTNKGFAGSTLTGLKRDPRKSNQCMYRIKPLPDPDQSK